MRSRLAALLGVALVGSGVTALGVTLSAQAAGEGVRLYLHSANGGYAADVAADPAAPLTASAPAGSKADTTAPTGTTSDTATVRATANAPASGQPDTPSFALPVTGAVSSVCLDLFASGPAGASISVFGFLSDANDARTSELAELKVTPYPGGIVRLTGSVAPQTPFTATADVAIGFFAGDLNGPGSNVVLSYDSAAHPSNVTVNPTSCTPVPVTAPSGSASGSASAAPSVSSTASPSVSASVSPSASASTAPSTSTSASPTQCPSTAPSASATATSAPTPSSSLTPSSTPTPTSTPVPSASSTTTAAPSPTATGMTPPATGAPVLGKQATPTASVSASASASPTAAPTGSPSAPPTDGCSTPTRITLNVTVAQITAGNAPTLFGVVTDDLNKAVVGARVDILSKAYAQTAYTRVATVVTDAEGRYALRIAPGRQTSYGANVGAIRSRVIQVRVNTRVSIARPAPSTVSNPVTFAGQLTPRFANVAVGLGYLTNGRFVVLTQTRTNASGGYSMTRALPRGTFAFVIFTSAHQGTDKGSKSVRLTVR